VPKSLPCSILSDKGSKVRRLYGVPNPLGIFAGRVTYVIDREGVVRHVFSSQIAVEKHVEEALKTLESIST
jgi:thioredoxin-dependent peroxiredoxin